MEKISESFENLKDIDNTELLFCILKKIKKAFEAVNYNIDILKKLNTDLIEIKNSIETSINDDTFLTIDYFNDNYNHYKEYITKNTNIVNEFLQNYIDKCHFVFTNSTIIENKKTNPCSSEKTHEEINDTVALEKDNNILLISEKENTVFLPYLLSDIKNIFEKNKDKYIDLQDVINKNYIVPLSRFKNPILSRFKEAFYLMKNKENASLPQCLDLALELAFNSLLNPSVIAACKNLDELDIYLDCLNNNELSKFTIFETVYEIAPSKEQKRTLITLFLFKALQSPHLCSFAKIAKQFSVETILL